MESLEEERGELPPMTTSSVVSVGDLDGADRRPDHDRPQPQHAARGARRPGAHGHGTRRRGPLSVHIRPVAGYRFRGGANRDASRVVAQPYDQITDELQARLYAMRAWNPGRPSYPRAEADADRYRAARRTLDAWRADGG